MTYKTWETFLDQMNESKDTVVLDLTKKGEKMVKGKIKDGLLEIIKQTKSFLIYKSLLNNDYEIHDKKGLLTTRDTLEEVDVFLKNNENKKPRI